jgi:hypothetical protein
MKTFRTSRSELMNYAVAERGESLSANLALTGIGASLEDRFDRADCKRRMKIRRNQRPQRRERDAKPGYIQ